MSLASPIQCIRILNPSSSSSSSTASSSNFRFSTTNTTPRVIIIRCSQAEGPLRRPSAPPTLREPSPPLKPTPPSSSPPSPPPPQKSVAVDGKGVITVEFQRQKAKELQDYFKKKKLEASGQGPFFGFQTKNEISNGRWAMFGFAVGMLTEYATGSDLVDQVKILFSNFGILDLE
ncbi:unnamed protein product [Cochlearia groenlandica]